VLVLSAAPSDDDAARLAAATRDGVWTIFLGDHAAARWRFVVSPEGRLESALLGISVEAARLPAARYTELLPLFGDDSEPDGGHRTAVRPRLPPSHLDAERSFPVEVRLLGPVTVDAPGELDPARADLLREFVVAVALAGARGVHPSVLEAALWPHGAADGVLAATVAHARAWLGPGRLRLGPDGRYRFGPDVRVDVWVFAALADDGGLPAARAALRLVRGHVLDALPAGRYGWLAARGDDARWRDAVVSLARRVADTEPAPSDVLAAARVGLRVDPANEFLWRAALRASAADPSALRAAACQLQQVRAEWGGGATSAETDSLLDSLLPGIGDPPGDRRLSR
jgi:hypothetical protein